MREEGRRRGVGTEEAEGEAGAGGGAAARPSRWLLLWVACRGFGVLAAGGGEWEKTPHFLLGKKGALKMMGETSDGGGRVNTSSRLIIFQKIKYSVRNL